jgi:hypothetical protein
MGRAFAERRPTIVFGQRLSEGRNAKSVDSSVESRLDESQKSGVVVEALLKTAALARFFRSADGRLHAEVPVDGRWEIYALKSTAFRHWLNESYRCVSAESCRRAEPSEP